MEAGQEAVALQWQVTKYQHQHHHCHNHRYHHHPDYGHQHQNNSDHSNHHSSRYKLNEYLPIHCWLQECARLKVERFWDLVRIINERQESVVAGK